jgi:hypothetical protein
MSKLDTPAQFAKHEHRRRVLRHMTETAQSSYDSQQAPIDLPAELNEHHYIVKLSHNNPIHIFKLLQQHYDDPAVAVGVTLHIIHLPYD